MIKRRVTRLGEYRIHSLHAGAGAPVVLMHGLCGSHRWWRHTLPALTPGFSVHVPELVGFGGTPVPGPQPTIERMAEIVTDWLASLGETRVRLVGHSMGGQIAIHMAADGAVERLVLTAAAGIPRPLSLAQIPRMLAEVIPPRRWGAPAFLPTLAADVVRTGPRVLWSATRRLLQDDVRPLLPRIQAPTLLLWGELDPLVPLAHAREMEQGIPNAELVVLRGAGHNPMVDRPAEFNRHLLAFFDDG